MRASATPTVLALSTALILGCMGSSDQERERKYAQPVQESRVDKALAVLGIEGPVAVEGVEGWWMGGVFHLRDRTGQEVHLPFGTVMGNSSEEWWSFIPSDFLAKNPDHDDRHVECAWIMLLDSWMHREFSTEQILEIAENQQRRELSTLEYAALEIMRLKRNPNLLDIGSCFEDDA